MERKNKPTNTAEAEWVKCQSKSRPGHFYMFNKSNGETKWCPSSGDIESKKEATLTGASSEKAVAEGMRKEKEPPPKLNLMTKSVRTPAQDRLKRLQNNLKKDKAAKVLTEAIDKNSNKEHKNISKSNDAINKSNKIKQTENQTAKQLEIDLRINTRNTSDKPKTKSNESQNCVLEKSVTKTPTRTAKKRTSSPEKATKPAKTIKIAPENTTDEEEIATQTDLNTTSSFGSGIFNKIKDICKSTLNIARNSTSSAIKKTSFKKTTNKASQQSSSAALKAAYNDIRGKNEESSSSADKQFVLKEISKATKTSSLPNYSTPKNLVVPNYQRGSANARLDRLRMSLLLQPSTSKQCALAEIPVSSTVSLSSDNKSINSSILSDDVEPMDWQETEQNDKNELIEVSISDSISLSSTSNFISKPDTTISEYYEAVNENLLRFSAEKRSNSRNAKLQWLNDHYYFVIDTNVLLEHITFIDDLTKMRLCDTKGTIIYVPYCVLQELDKLKIRARSEGAKLLTVRAIKYLNTQFEAQNKQIRAQSASDERDHLIDVTSPDDSILNCCLQVKQHVENVILLTEDVNLRNKAICNNLLVSTKSDLISHHAPSSSSKAWYIDAK